MNILSFYKNNFQSVKSKLILNVIMIHVILMSFVVIDLTTREQKFMQKQLLQKGYELNTILTSNVSSALLNNDLVALDELLVDMSNIKDHYMSFILDRYGRVRASTNKDYFNKLLDDKVSTDIFEKLSKGNLTSYQIVHDNLIDTISAIKIGDRNIGYTRTLIDKSFLSSEMEIHTQQASIYIILAIVIGAFFAWLAVRKITDKLNLVVNAAEKISKRNFDVNIPITGSNDELTKMIEAFNIMSKSINGYIKEQKESELKLLEAQEIAHIGSWDLDLKTSKMQWSPELYNIYDKDKKTYEPTLDNYLQSLDNENRKLAEDGINQVISERKQVDINVKYNLDNGKVIYVRITGVAHYDKDGSPYKIAGTTQDVTQHKEDEIALKLRDNQLLIQSRLAQMGEMISMIAHQWRQPLSAISSTAINLKVEMDLGLLSKEKDEAKLKEHISNELDSIEMYTQNLSTTIDDFRNFYKSNKKVINCTVDSVLEKALKIIKTSLENDNISIVYEPNSTKKIDMFDGEIMQVILNILKNAQDDFLERDIKNPRIKIVTNDNSMQICDNGGGIEKNIIDKIFDPYFSSKDERNGTGLGLYMSKIIVEDHHHGLIRAHNTDDGVCFKIELNL